ncbi:MAG: hypothetical protein ACLSH0_10265 [Mediterraneibacter faecis]
MDSIQHPAPGDPETPYYVALDIAENGQMTAYRKLKDGSQLNVDIYKFNENGDYVVSYTTESGKAFIPDEEEADFSYNIQIIDKEKAKHQFSLKIELLKIIVSI